MSISNLYGIDISSWQNELSAESLNSVDFAILKISEGQTWVDPVFNSFYSMAKIPLGAYVYSHAITEEQAVNEANKAISLINGRNLPLGIYIDVEESSQLALSDIKLTSVVKAFCDTIKKAGYLAGAYGSSGNLWAKVGPKYLGEDVIVWNACWGSNEPTMGDLWQFTSSDHITGYIGFVDGNKVLSERFAKLVSNSEYKPQPISNSKTCEVTIKFPVLSYNPAIKSTYVEIVQKMLIAKNYPCGALGADGYFGTGTLQAVKNFREENNLSDKENIDGPFWKKLLSI